MGDGWSYGSGQATWEGTPASSVPFNNAFIDGMGSGITIVCTLETLPATYDVTANLADGAYWSTFYSNEGNYQAPEGTQVFKVALEGTGITLTEITDRIVNAGQGVVLKSNSASITLASAASESETSYDGNSLTGTMTEINTTGANNYYVLNKKSAGIGFYKLSNTSGTIGANKAYLTYSGGAGVREFFAFNMDDATSINEELGMKNEELYEGAIYNFAGQRIQKMQKGINIVNGKKVLK